MAEIVDEKSKKKKKKTRAEVESELALVEAGLINKNAKISEAYLVGLMWANPDDCYSSYKELIDQDMFIHKVWGFYYELGRVLYESGAKSYDVITVRTQVKALGVEKEFDEHGGFKIIEDTIDIVGENNLNIEKYVEELERNYTLKQYYGLFGDKVLLEDGKYNHKKMSAESISVYWQDKVNSLNVSTVSKYEVEDLYIEADKFIERLEEESAEMLPLYKSPLMNKITQGVPRGNVLMFGGFGGSGKSSITIEKFAMSCIANQEKTMIILNEEDAQAFRQKMVLTILWHEFELNIDRKRMSNGGLTEEDKEKIRMAFQRFKEMIGADVEGNEESAKQLIKVVFMEKYVMKDLEKIVRFWANRGYTNLMIDTHKVSEESPHSVRWETFVEDMKLIYRLTRKNAGGLNLRTWVTFQLADSALNNRYLDYDAIGEGKASKNEAGIVFMFRPVWTDEYKGQKKELKPFKLVMKKSKGMDGGKKWRKEFFDLEEETTYYLLFTPKNRYGEDNTTGQAVLILKPHFNSNTFEEVGWAIVANEKGNR